MLRVAVVDDEINTLKYIKKIVEREFVSNGIECEYFLFLSALQFVEEQNINNFDIVFLDIMIPEFSGFQAARQIRDSNCQTRIIFITSNEESVYESFDFQPFNFVKKDCNDIFEGRMKYIIKNLIHHLKQKNTIIFKLSLSEEKKMEICNIIAIKSDGNYLEVHCCNGIKLVIRNKISDYEEKLKPYDFIRVHNRWMINMRHILQIDYTNEEITMESKVVALLSRSHKNELKRKYAEFLRST